MTGGGGSGKQIDEENAENGEEEGVEVAVWGVRRGEVFPYVAAVAWLSATLKITAFTLQLKNSSSDDLFSWSISSGLAFPGPLRLPLHLEHGHMVQPWLTEEFSWVLLKHRCSIYCRVDDIKSSQHCN